MSVESLLEKLRALGLEEDKLSAIIDDIQHISPAKKDDEDAQVRELKAANRRILEEKKAMQSKLAESEASLEEARTADLSEQDKLQHQLTKLEAQNAEYKAAVESSAVELKTAKREWALGNISKQFEFVEGVPEYLQTAAIKASFSEVEDLNDTDSVSAAVEAFRETNKGILAAEAVGGAETRNKTSSKAPTGEPTLAQRSAELASLNTTI